ncbi:uncharacterized protein LOC108045276 [Drosophila rhopaloa]|uniref:Uncharacterized protein LOC108045276 n=1 Tax=Drosophila rhopaloa TaxID=1041015 RepID=A0A6P4EPE1_DRORH|nr:uncharacterized protein LOC108045276 [Drosophila rhopaloa]
MERRRPRKSSRHLLTPKSNASGSGRGSRSSSASPEVAYNQPTGNGVSPTITSLLGGRLNRVSRLTRSPRGLQVTETPESGGVGFTDERESGQSETSDVSPGVMVSAASASPRGSAVHGHLIAFAGPRDSDSPRISVEVPEVFSTSSRATSVANNLRFGPNVAETDNGGGVNFGANSYFDRNRNSSMMSGTTYDDYEEDDQRASSSPDIGACRGAWAQQQQHQSVTGHTGRDTLGFAIHLGTATMGHNRCTLGTACEDDCGYGTGCDAGCSEAHGIEPGSFMLPAVTAAAQGSGGAPLNSAIRGVQVSAVGPGGGPGGAYPGAAYPGGGYPGGGYPGGAYPAGGGYKPVGSGPGPGHGPSSGSSGQRGSFGVDLGSDQLNFFITFLLEVLGVLVFFAICTITFWITLGYHVVQLLVDLKNAERNVQVAVAIVFGLLLVAFAISQVTNSSGSCCHARDRARSRSKGGCPFHRSAKSTAKSKPKSFAHKARSCPHKPKTKKETSDGGGCRRMCSAKMELHSHRKPRYTDCEGRAIFLSSRRYAIPTEMKQPPTIVLWLRDVLARMMQ